MSGSRSAPDTAFRVADRLRGKVADSWDVFGESIRRFEVHFNGPSIEMIRGPIRLEGYGIREIHPRTEDVGVGFAASSDMSPEGIDRTREQAESAGKFASFPAKSLQLPNETGPGPAVETVDRNLWERPSETIEAFVSDLLAHFEGRSATVPSFGSVRATLSEATLANSAGAERHASRTSVALEVAVKATAGPEGPRPGEYWVNQESVRLDARTLRSEVDDWCRKASEARHAGPTPAGEKTVVFPAEVLSDIVPPILGFRLGGAAELRSMMPPPGTVVGVASLDVTDDGLFPFGMGTAPWDDEGTVQGHRRLISKGVVSEPLYDILHSSALGTRPTGNGRRDQLAYSPWFRFTIAPTPSPTTMVIASGTDGSDQEIAEAVGEGLWVDQLGYAFPDPVSSAFGGEIRIAYRIRNGKLAETVRGGTVGGMLLAGPNEPSLLASARLFGTPTKLSGRLSTPTMAVGGMTVAGVG